MKQKLTWPNLAIGLFCLMLTFIASAVHAQSGSISGKITDSKGEPASGASVMIKGSQRGTSAGADGIFLLKNLNNGNYILVVSYVGAETKEVKAVVDGNQPVSLNIRMNGEAQALSDVIVVGYGQQRKKDVTGALSIVSANSFKDAPVSSIDQKLVGQVPGVQISSVTGTPGGGTNIKIRGSGSIGAGDQPLFVVDGFPLPSASGQLSNPLASINPNDIESVTILKDASSTAIYGSRGANGVVVITTKRGKKGLPVVNVNAYTGLQQVPQKGRPDMLNAREFAQFRKEIIIDAFAARGQVPADTDIPVEYRNPAQYGTGTNWYDALLKDAMQHNINASISGGSDNSRYLVSLDYLKQDGTVRYTGYERYGIRTNVETNLGTKLKIGLNLAPTYSVQQLSNFENGFTDLLASSNWLSPLIPITDANGKRIPFIQSPGTLGMGNPLNVLEFAGTRLKNFRGLGNAYAEWQMVRGLTAKYSMNIDYNEFNSFMFNPDFVPTGLNAPPPVVPFSNTVRGDRFNYLSEILLTYDKSFGTNHRLNIVAGYSAQSEKSNVVSLTARNYPDNTVQSINAATQVSAWNQDIQKWAVISYLSRVNYTYKDKYILTGTIRSDGSSRFGQNRRYGTFPSAAIGWVVSQEKFLRDIVWMNEFKLRASYGLSGNYNIGNYTYLSNVNTLNYVFGGQIASGRVVTSLNNPNLTWEEASQFDLGADFSLFNRKVTITIDYYNRISRNNLYNTELPLNSGFTTATINTGKIQNQGLEIGITTTNIAKKDFKWTTSANIAFNKNKVLALNDNNAPIYSGRSGEGNFTHITQVGHPIAEFFGYVIDGVYSKADIMDPKVPKHVSSIEGSIKYKDIDGNGVVEPFKDFAVLGKPQPDFIYGITNNLSYKQFDLNVVLVGSQGNQILKTSKQFLNNIDGVFNVTHEYYFNRWRSAQNPGDGKTPTTNGARVMYRDVNSSWVEDGSFMRIQNITLGYTVGAKLLQRSKVIHQARIYLSAQNLATFTNYSGGNPEISRNTISGNASTNALVPGEDFVGYPLARIYTVGVNFTF